MSSSVPIIVTCPACGHEFSLSEAVLGSLREGVRKEFSADLSKREQSLEKKIGDMRLREEQLQKQAGDIEIEVNKQLQARLTETEKRVRKQAEDAIEVRLKDLESQLNEKA